MENNLGDMLRRALSGENDKKMEPVGALSAKDLREWNEIHAKAHQLSTEAEALDARRKLFWARLKLANPMLQCRETISIENGLVLASVDTGMPEIPSGLPTFPEMPDAPGE